MKIRLTLLMMVLGFCFMQAEANNVRITDRVKVAGRLGKDTIVLTFPLKWDNSWRLDENWDAVYLFIKYKRMDVEEPWRHLCVKEDGHRVDAGYTWSVAKAQDERVSSQSGASNVGLFVFRDVTGAGPASTMVRVAVDISKGDLQPHYKATYDDFRNGKIDISVAAIEMVFVPRGPYYLGDGISYDCFGNNEKDPYLVTNDNAMELRVRNGDTQEFRTDTVKVRKEYPKGYDALYCMKYEISQEQYVYFLNKLPYDQQKKRIKYNLDELSIGDYVLGSESNKRSYPQARNGIMLEKRKDAEWGDEGGTRSGLPVIFGHNLNQEDGMINGPKDGKTIACNFLTPEDAKAYADWVGLRLMSELEYEKICRLRNPAVRPTGYQYAWNGMTLKRPLSTLVTGTEGTVYEEMAGEPNTNAGSDNFNGPVRCGSFAKPNTTAMDITGASFWGAMDMTGNLSEMVCNANVGGMMSTVDGDGSLSSEVITWERDTSINWYGTVGVPPYTEKVMVRRYLGTKVHDRWGQPIVIVDSFWITTTPQKESYSHYYSEWHTLKLPSLAWPDTLAAYGVKGGSFKDKDRKQLAVSSRSEVSLFWSGVNINPALSAAPRLSSVTFRLVKRVPVAQIKAGRIGLQNDEFKDTTILCSASPYVIKELDAGSSPSSSVLYEWEMNDGKGWKKIEGEIKQTLTLTEHWNNDTLLQSREYRRKSMTPVGEGYSNTVTLTLVGRPRLKPLQSVIGDCNRTVSMTGRVDVVMDSIIWYRQDNGAMLGAKLENVTQSEYIPNRVEFPNPGSYGVVCKAYLDGCPVSRNGFTKVEPPYDPSDCPPTVTDVEGNVYRAAILADCRCWLLDPLKKEGLSGTSLQSPDGIMMYNFEDLRGEASSYNTEGRTSSLCPEHFFVPTEAEVTNLIENLFGAPASPDIKGPQAYGFLDDTGNHVAGGYYWAVIYSKLDENSTYIDTRWVMTIDAEGKLKVEQEVAWDDGAIFTAHGDMYFPVRCIRERAVE